MKRFIIIDHSLCSLQGHHYECSVSVAKAAANLGYQPIIIANRTFPLDLQPEGIKILPRFEVDWFDNLTTINKTANWKSKIRQILGYLQNNPFENFQKTLQERLQYQRDYWNLTKPKLRLLLEKIEGSTTRLGQWFQKDIKLLGYIPFSNTLWGLFKIVWGLIRYIFNRVFQKSLKILEGLIETHYESFAETLNQVLQELKVNSDDEILIHTIGISQVEDVYHYLSSQSHDNLPQFHLLLRRDIDESLVIYAKGMGLKACLNYFADSKLWPNKVKFYSDTKELVERYNRLSTVKFTKVPVPFPTEKLSLSENKKRDEPIHLVYLGDARYEKGYHHLPKIIESLWKDYLSQDKAKFTIQSNFNVEGGEAKILDVRLQLEQYPSSKVRLIKEVMKSEDYYQLLSDADIVILPYDPVSYRHRTSGVLTEALAAGKPVVVPNHSWLAQQVDESRGKIYDDPKYIGDKVKEILANLESFKTATEKFRLKWLQQNTPKRFVKALLSSPDFTVQSENRITEAINTFPSPIQHNILFVISAEDIFNDSSYQQRLLKHWDYLLTCGYQLSLITFSKYSPYQSENCVPFQNQLRQITDEVTFSNLWILDYAIYPCIPDDVDAKLYLNSVRESSSSLVQDLVYRNSLNIDETLIQLCKTHAFNLVYTNSLLNLPIINKLGISSSNLVCDLNHLLCYQYALVNHREIDTFELEEERKLLSLCPNIITNNLIQVEKFREIVPSEKIRVISCESNDYFAQMDQLLRDILGTQALGIRQENHIGIFYPWGDILEAKSGASKRVSLLIEYLKEQGYQVWVLTTGQQQDFYLDNVRYTFYEQNPSHYNLVQNIYQDAYQALQVSQRLEENKDIAELQFEEKHWLPWIYYQFRFDEHFKYEINKIADWAKVILLEYPFWGTIVGEICQHKSVKLIITAHDVLFQQLSLNSSLRKIATAEEIEGLKQADELVCVSPEDQAFLASYQLTSRLIPNPIGNEDFSLENTHLSNLSEKGLIIDQFPHPFCLFVGSQHLPNLHAVSHIRQIASETPNCFFIIAGGCCPPEVEGNFIALGKVSLSVLVALYQQASLVICPLTAGTGSSLKIVEAMAYGKVVLGTQIAFRGYPVTSGVNCFIEDDFSRYPYFINELLKESEQLKEVAKKAKEFAEKYDYRQLYQAYLKLIEEKI